jgi:hypothetical protein
MPNIANTCANLQKFLKPFLFVKKRADDLNSVHNGSIQICVHCLGQNGFCKLLQISRAICVLSDSSQNGTALSAS